MTILPGFHGRFFFFFPEHFISSLDSLQENGNVGKFNQGAQPVLVHCLGQFRHWKLTLSLSISLLGLGLVHQSCAGIKTRQGNLISNFGLLLCFHKVHLLLNNQSPTAPGFTNLSFVSLNVVAWAIHPLSLSFPEPSGHISCDGSFQYCAFCPASGASPPLFQIKAANICLPIPVKQAIRQKAARAMWHCSLLHWPRQ